MNGNPNDHGFHHWLGHLAPHQDAQPAPPPPPDRGAGVVPAAPPANVSPIPVPVWAQNMNDYPGPDGIDVYHATDCGEQSAAMVIRSTRGVELPEELIREYINAAGGGNKDSGITSAQDLAGYLQRQYIGAQVVNLPWPEIRTRLEMELASGHPAILLGTWVDPSIEHWIVLVAYSANGLSAHDPWAGRAVNIDWSHVEAHQAGCLITVAEEARYGR